MTRVADLFDATVTRTIDVSELRADEASPELLACESGRVVLLDYGEEPLELYETDEGFLAAGENHAVLLSDDQGVLVKEHREGDEEIDEGRRPRRLKVYGRDVGKALKLARQKRYDPEEITNHGKSFEVSFATPQKAEAYWTQVQDADLMVSISTMPDPADRRESESADEDRTLGALTGRALELEQEIGSMTDIDEAVLVLGEGKLELRTGDDEGAVLLETDCDTDDPRAVRAATVHLREQAEDAGYEEDIEFPDVEEDDEEAMTEAIRELSLDVLEDVSALLGDVIGADADAHLADIQAFDRSVEEGDLDQALSRAALIGDALSPEIGEAVRKMSRAAVAKRMRNARTRTPEEKLRARKAAKLRRKGSYKAKAKRYARKYKARRKQLSASEESEAQLDLLDEAGYSDDTYKKSMKGRACTDDGLKKACAGFFKSAKRPTTYKGLKEALVEAGHEVEDQDLLKVLSGLVNDGEVTYTPGEGYLSSEG